MKAAALAALALVCSGCSRADMNYQIAEALGTVGVYDNGEPVESPQMEEERHKREVEESEAAVFEGQLAEATTLAAGYWYDEAIEKLQQMLPKGSQAEGADGQGDEASGGLTGEQTRQVQDLIEEYAQAKDSLTAYEGPVPHLCFPTLIEDTNLAFDGDDYASKYDSVMITTKEFKAILESLYANDYVLVDIHDVAGEVKGDYGGVTVEQKTLQLPPGKKPLIISQDNVNYSEVRNGDGIARRLVLDDNEQVKALYTDGEGHDKVGDYDLIPILETFVSEHPDFSFRGAKGIISVSGSLGMYGYDISSPQTAPISHETEKSNDKKQLDEEFSKKEEVKAINVGDTATEGQRTAAAISTVLKRNGWSLACAGYSHKYLNDMTLDGLKADLQSWYDEVEVLTGSTDILFYPYGGEVPAGDGLEYIKSQGYVYLCGLYTADECLQIQDGYVRQTRRFIDGYTLKAAAADFMQFFNATALLDSDR